MLIGCLLIIGKAKSNDTFLAWKPYYCEANGHWTKTATCNRRSKGHALFGVQRWVTIAEREDMLRLSNTHGNHTMRSIWEMSDLYVGALNALLLYVGVRECIGLYSSPNTLRKYKEETGHNWYTTFDRIIRNNEQAKDSDSTGMYHHVLLLGNSRQQSTGRLTKKLCVSRPRRGTKWVIG